MNKIRRGNIYTLAILLIQLLVIAVYPLFAPAISGLPYSLFISQLGAQIFCFVPPLAVYLLTAGRNSTFAFRPLNITNTILIFFMCVTIQPAMTALSALSMTFFENPVNDYIYEMMELPFPAALTVMAVAPAFFEELAMRGVVLKNHEQLPIRKAAVVNGLFFGIMHLSPQQFLYAFMMGAIFSYFVYYTKSLWASVLGHFIINASQVLMAYISYSALEGISEEALAALESPTTNELINIGIFITVVTAIFLPVFLILFRSFIGYNKRRLFLDEMAQAELEEAVAAPDMPEPPGKVIDWVFVCIVAVFAVFVVVVG